MNGQWLKLHRKSVDSRVFSDPTMWHLWSWILMNANWKLGYFQGFEVHPGSLASSYESIGCKLGCCKSTVHKRLKKLESWGMISLKCERYFTIISICNWKTYQDYNQDDANATRTQREQNENTTQTQRETIEESKEEKRKEKEGKDTREEPQNQIDSRIIHIAQQYCFLSTKKNKFGFPAETEQQVVPVFVELVRQGIPLSLIVEHVNASVRNRNQPLWEFEREVRSTWKSQQPTAETNGKRKITNLWELRKAINAGEFGNG